MEAIIRFKLHLKGIGITSREFIENYISSLEKRGKLGLLVYAKLDDVTIAYEEDKLVFYFKFDELKRKLENEGYRFEDETVVDAPHELIVFEVSDSESEGILVLKDI